MAALGVPIRSPQIPQKRFLSLLKELKSLRQNKTTSDREGYTPEPTLDDSIYQQILKIIHDVGRQLKDYLARMQEKKKNIFDHILLT